MDRNEIRKGRPRVRSFFTISTRSGALKLRKCPFTCSRLLAAAMGVEKWPWVCRRANMRKGRSLRGFTSLDLNRVRSISVQWPIYKSVTKSTVWVSRVGVPRLILPLLSSIQRNSRRFAMHDGGRHRLSVGLELRKKRSCPVIWQAFGSSRNQEKSRVESLPGNLVVDKVNLSTPRPEGRCLPSTRATRLSSPKSQAEGLKVHPALR